MNRLEYWTNLQYRKFETKKIRIQDASCKHFGKIIDLGTRIENTKQIRTTEKFEKKRRWGSKMHRANISQKSYISVYESRKIVSKKWSFANRSRFHELQKSYVSVYESKTIVSKKWSFANRSRFHQLHIGFRSLKLRFRIWWSKTKIEAKP